MYHVEIESVFFCNGKSYNQLIGVFSELNEATRFTVHYVNTNPEFKHHLIAIKEKYIK